MSDISRRSLYKVTYAPIRPSEEDQQKGTPAKLRRGLEKVVFANALHATTSEIEMVKRTLEHEPERATLAALDAISDANRRSGWRELSRTSVAALVAAGRALATHRRTRRSELHQVAKELADDYTAFVRASLEAAAPLIEFNLVNTNHTNPWKVQPISDPRLNATSLQPSFVSAMDWARVREPERANTLGQLARDVAGIATDSSNLVGVKWDSFTAAVVETSETTADWTDDLIDGFEERMKVEAAGRLHLERIDMTPVGVMRGELVHSVGLAPEESVTLIHREWSLREVGFEKVVTEEFEQSQEEGVTVNTELATATETQSRHSSALSTEATASGSYGFVTGSASVGYNSTSDDEIAKRDSRNHAIQITRKASSRSRTEHKVTFTVKEQAGVEDQSVRTLKNPSKTEPLRVDFHQMIRKWQVDLYRYDERLTYDIVVPAPGIDLLTKVDEIYRIEHQLRQQFMFTLMPSEITREEWQTLAARYGADVEPPEPEKLLLHRQFQYPDQSSAESLEHYRFDTLEFDVPAGYFVSTGTFQAFFTLYEGGPLNGGHFDLMEDLEGATGHTADSPLSHEIWLDHLKDRTGQIALVMASNGLASGYAKATLEVLQSPENWRAWQNRAWVAMRKSAEELWQTQRQDLQQRREQLQEEISRWDPLTLRRMEREEVMKTTLKWIFGPAFDLMPNEVTQLYEGDAGGLATIEPAELTAGQWAHTLGLGEFIKFLHQAIEWENVLFFVYPYFWDNPRNHELKRFLHHPDSLHQTFLRGGAARVVLTVRPGFEDSFTKLVETGGLDEELGDHPYVTIAEEIRAFAGTHYPGIPGTSPGNQPTEEEVADAERGEQIARWYEYTPISALDITVNTPLDQLK